MLARSLLPIAMLFVVVDAALGQPVAVTTVPPAASPVAVTYSIGSLAGDVLQWVIVAFVIPAIPILSALALKWLQRFNIQISDQQRARLDEMVINGINANAPKLLDKFKASGQIEIRNQVVNSAVEYVQKHGSDTIKALGLDPKSGDAVEAIRARIETALLDPAAPTNPAIPDPPAKPAS